MHRLRWSSFYRPIARAKREEGSRLVRLDSYVRLGREGREKRSAGSAISDGAKGVRDAGTDPDVREGP